MWNTDFVENLRRRASQSYTFTEGYLKEMTGNMGFIPGLRRPPEGMTGEATVHEVTKSQTQLKRPKPEHIQRIKWEEPGYYNKRSKF